MNVAEIRAKYWRLRSRLDKDMTTTVDREIAMLEAEMLVEIAAQLAAANAVLARVGVLNFEELALRLEDLFKKKQETS
jgi:peptide subunit release factor RF-3